LKWLIIILCVIIGAMLTLIDTKINKWIMQIFDDKNEIIVWCSNINDNIKHYVNDYITVNKNKRNDNNKFNYGLDTTRNTGYTTNRESYYTTNYTLCGRHYVLNRKIVNIGNSMELQCGQLLWNMNKKHECNYYAHNSFNEKQSKSVNIIEQPNLSEKKLNHFKNEMCVPVECIEQYLYMQKPMKNIYQNQRCCWKITSQTPIVTNLSQCIYSISANNGYNNNEVNVNSW